MSPIESPDSAVEKPQVAAVAGDAQFTAARRQIKGRLKQSLRDPSETGKGREYFADESGDAEDSEFGTKPRR